MTNFYKTHSLNPTKAQGTETQPQGTKTQPKLT